MSVSTPKDSGADIDGVDYNNLREDLFGVHNHDGTRNGVRISHGDLVSGATVLSTLKTHQQIEADLSSLFSRTPWTFFDQGRLTWADCESNFTAHGQHIRYAAAFTSNPVVLVSHYWLTDGGGGWNNMRIIMNPHTPTNTGISLYIQPSHTTGLFNDWGASGTQPKTNFFVNWIAIGS